MQATRDKMQVHLLTASGIIVIWGVTHLSMYYPGPTFLAVGDPMVQRGKTPFFSFRKDYVDFCGTPDVKNTIYEKITWTVIYTILRSELDVP
jgi:hypothetical protein